MDADTIVVGAPWHNSKQGAVYVFNEPDSGGWVDTSTAAKLTAGDGAANDQFGYSVALDADTIVVGAPWHNSKQGAVYVFNEPDSGGWVDTSTAAKLTAGDGAANDQFGYSVALDADTIVVGAPWHNSKQGAVYVFNEPDSGGWVDTSTAAKLTAGDGAANDQFGYSVALDADTIVVGAPWHNSKQGAVYVFNEPDSGGWVDTSTAAKLTAGDGTDSDEFGISVALDGDKAVVGAHMDDRDNAVPDSGSVYVFTRETVAWNETVQLAAPDAFSTDHFGNSVALSGGTVLAGAPLDDDNAADSGSAYVMDVGRTDATIWADVNPLELISDSADYYYRTLGLINDQEYAFRVRAVNAGGNTPSAETRSAVPLLKKPDRPTGLTAEAGSRRVNLSWDRSYDSTITGYQALTLKIDKLTTSDRKEDDNFGSAVAMDDGIAVVGSPQDHTRNGAAYIFIRDSGGAWSEVAQLTASDGALDDEFGHSVAVNGDTIVIGAPQDDDNGSNSGSAYVFTKPTTSGGWADTTGIETAKLTASDGAAADEFGHSVAVDGDTVVIGARGDDDNGSNSGSAYVFTKPASEGGWSVSGDTDVGTGQVKHTETAQLTDSDGKPGDRFGQSVAVQSTDAGDTVVVGAHLDDDIDTDAANAGAVYVLTEPGNGWEGWNALDNLAKENLTAKLTVADGEAEDNLGYSVAIDGDTVVAGAQREDDFRGAVYVFTDPGGGWATGTETARLTASDRQGNEYFGYSVAVHGGVVVIGAYAADIDPEYSNENLSSGAAYVFTKPGNAWVEGTETAKLILPNSDGMDGTEEDDDFGNSVAVDSESIIIGAPLDDVVVEDNQEVLNAGSMYASGIPQWTLIDPSNDTTTSHTVYELIGGVEYTFQVRAVDEVGSSPPSNIVHATPRGSSGGGTEPPNYGPSFVSGNNLTPAVDENAPPGTPVGSPITATDPEDDDLTYYLQGDDAFPFGIVAETGQLTVKDPLDYEVKSLYRVTVRVNDNSNPSKVVDVTIKVNNLDETGTISLSSQQTKVGTALTAEVSDPDGSVTGVTWQWASSPDLVNWQNIAGATSNIYTPVAQDVDRFLRVTVSYADGEGSGKQEQFNFSVAVQGPPMPMATPAPEPPERDERPTPGPRSTPEPTAAPTVKPTRVAERPAVPRPEAMARPTPETSGIPMPETGAIFVPEPTLLPTPALAPVGTPVLAQNPTAIPTPTTAPAPATPQVAPDDEGGVNGWLITLLAGGAVAIAAGTFFVVWIRG